MINWNLVQALVAVLIFLFAIKIADHFLFKYFDVESLGRMKMRFKKIK